MKAKYYYIENEKIKNISLSVNNYKRLLSMSEKDRLDFIENKFSFKSKKNKKNEYINFSKFKFGKGICKLKGRIYKDDIDYLKNLSKEAGKSKDGKFKHYEVGGLLSFKKDKDNIYDIKIKKSGQIIGNENGTNVPKGRGGFHTHPHGEYIAQNVKYAWPSEDDYAAILEKFIKEKCILHIVATKEGIYIVSQAESAIKKGMDFFKDSYNEKLYKKYKFNLPSKNGVNALTPKEYVSKLNRIHENDKIFHVEYQSWTSVKKGKLFNFYFSGPSCKP